MGPHYEEEIETEKKKKTLNSVYICYFTLFLFAPGTITKLNESTDYISGNKRGSEVLGLFNIHNSDGTINLQDGLLLAEAMRYAIALIPSKRAHFNYKIIDLKGETRNIVNLLTTFQDLKFTAIISAVETRQTYFAAQLYSRDTYNIPMYNTLASNSILESAKQSGSSFNVFQSLPDEEMEVTAIADILLKMNWMYVSVASSYDSFIQKSVAYFLSLAKTHFICIAKHVTLQANLDAEDLEEQIAGLSQDRRAKIIVLFTLPYMTRRVLNALSNETNLHIVSGTNWRPYMATVKDSLRAAKGSIFLQYRRTTDEEFNKHFMNLTLNAYQGNKWFEQFWEETFSCQAKARKGVNQTMPNCTGFESLQGRVNLNHSVIRPTIFAIESIACTVECIGKSKCSWCRNHGDLFYKCITAYFREFQEKCQCSSYRSLLGSKSITENVDGNSLEVWSFNGEEYVAVGLWQLNQTTNVAKLDLNASRITWKHSKKPESYCYKPCLLGEIQQYEAVTDGCCYECIQCKTNEITNNETCVACAHHTAPNPTRDTCVPLPRRYIDDETAASTTLKAASFLGIASNTAISVIFAKYWNTKIVKATGRELIVPILIALFMCFASPLVFLMRPSVVVCGIQRFILGFCSISCYVPLLLKTNRIYRIFTASRKLSLRQSFVSTKSQILLCFGFFFTQVLLGIVWIVGNIPEIELLDVNRRTETAVLCKLESINIIFNLIPCLVLMAACTFYGYKTRNFPSNFNEAYSISITMYVSCFLWGIFIPSLFLLESRESLVFSHVFLLAGFMIVIGYATEIGLFAAKVFKIFQRQKIESSFSQSQFFFSSHESRRESTITKCSQSTVVSHPCSIDQRQHKLDTFSVLPGEYFPFDSESYTGLRSRTVKEARVRSGSC